VKKTSLYSYLPSFVFYFFCSVPCNIPIRVNAVVISKGDTIEKQTQSLTINTVENKVEPEELQTSTPTFSIFPVGLNLGKRNINPSVMIRGREDGKQAIDLQNWLVPFDAVIETLDLSVKTLPDGQLELRSSGIVTSIDPKKLVTDPELGLVFSIKDLDTLFGVKAKFDIIEYAIDLDIPWLNQRHQSIGQAITPIVLEGLPRISANNFSFSSVEQKLNANATEGTSTSYRGDFLAVGSAFGGSWFLRAEQPNLQNANTWKIAEAQFLRQTNQADYILGSQPIFWLSGETSEYWGVTYIQRKGFTPPQQVNGSFVDPRLRLQSGSFGRTITGRTEPGTLVRLVESFGDRLISEVLVDSSGIYRFENVKSDNQSLGNSYRVLLYPEGRLTAQPIIREASYSIVPGQLPTGTSALVVSGGLGRNVETQRNMETRHVASLQGFRGGIAQRWGVSENLTLGLGGVYDENVRGVAELFYRSPDLPLEVAISALTGNNWDINADIRFSPTPTIKAIYTTDRFSSRFNVDWRIFPNISLFANTDSRSATAGGIQLNFSGRNFFTFARASLDAQNRLRWTLLQRLGRLELNQRGNEIGTLSELSYNLSGNSGFLNLGHSLLFNYETRSLSGNNLLTLGWRYRSQERATDGNYLWDAQLGYSVGSQGSGAIATLSTTVFPGMLLRARYQGVSVTSDDSSFSLDLVSSLGLQRGITPGDRRSNYFRTQGGLLIQSFFDKNNNGKKDSGEEIYIEHADTLLTINNRLIKTFQPQIMDERIMVRLNPGTYRLDLDPSGFPENWQALYENYAVDVVAGSYTPVLLPLTRSYTFSGVVTDAKGNPIAGAKVEAISTNNPQLRLFSVTNTAGIYYLERLRQETYNLFINDKSVNGTQVKLDNSSSSNYEFNIQQLENLDYVLLNKDLNQSVLPSIGQ
jgi:Carboxypeptidase regulatory-like domain